MISLLALASLGAGAQNLQKGDYGYLYCHMSGRGEWTAYALSRDGVHFHDLIDGDPVYNVEEMSKILKVSKEDINIAIESARPVESIENKVFADKGEKTISIADKISAQKDEQ